MHPQPPRMKPDLMDEQNKVFAHLLQYQKLYFVMLALLAIGSIFILNSQQHKPMLMGEETYYHLQRAQHLGWRNYYDLPLSGITRFLPTSTWILLPLLLAITAVLLLLSVAARLNLPAKITFFLTLFFITSPAFIFSFSTLSAHAIFLWLALLGIYLSERNSGQQLAVVAWLLATSIDLFSSVLLLLSLSLFHLYRPKKTTMIALICLAIAIPLQGLFFHQPFILGPFHQQQIIADVVSDLGGRSGIGFFILLLSIIGMAISWKKKNIAKTYLFLPVALFGYIYSTETILIFSLLLVFFAAVTFVRLFEKPWVLDSLRKFTFLLLLLGVLFSLLTYVERASTFPPSAADERSLLWMSKHLPEDAVVFSAPENSYFIRYFSQREPLYYLHQAGNEQHNATQAILAARYIQELFPLLEQHHISVIYITPVMKEKLPVEQGLLFLFKNERFKLAYSYREVGVWIFSGGWS